MHESLVSPFVFHYCIVCILSHEINVLNSVMHLKITRDSTLELWMGSTDIHCLTLYIEKHRKHIANINCKHQMYPHFCVCFAPPLYSSVLLDNGHIMEAVNACVLIGSMC